MFGNFSCDSNLQPKLETNESETRTQKGGAWCEVEEAYGGDGFGLARLENVISSTMIE